MLNPDWRSPKGFSICEPEATSKARPSGGFLAFGLAKDVAKGSPLENSEGAFNILPREYIKGPPEGSIHYDTSEAFPQVLIFFT